MDCRLSALGTAASYAYTRYADNLAFSAGEARGQGEMERFTAQVVAITAEEGFGIHHRKTRVMRRGVRQHLACLVVNERVNVARDEVDRLKAVLTNCVRWGPASQNRAGDATFREHLLGRVSFVASVHRARRARLRAIFDGILWETGPPAYGEGEGCDG